MDRLFVAYMGSLMLRSIVIAAIAGICSWKLRNVAVRHAVWVAVLCGMLLMPVVDYFMPASWVPASIQEFAAQQPVTFRVASARAIDIPRSPAPPSQSAAAEISSESRRVNWWSAAAALYALVALAMLMRLTMGYWKMRKLRRTGSAIASSVWDEIVALYRTRWRIPALLESDSVQVPMTVGLVRPSVILPVDWKTWDEWKLRAVLLHEVAHIRRGDWGIAVMAAAAKCAYWLNPLFWYLERKLSQLAEQASDDASLSQTHSATRYAEILLEFATATQNGGRLMNGGVAMAQQNMKARIERVLGKPQSGTGFVRIAGWTLVIVLSVPVIYSAAALQVASKGVPATIPAHSTVLTTATSPQGPTGQQPKQESAQTALAQAAPGPSSQAMELQKAFEVELERAKVEQVQRTSAEPELRKLIEELAQEFRNVPEMTSRAGLLQEDLVTLENKMRQVEAETEMLKSRIGQSTTTQEMAQAAQAQLLMLQARQRELGERLAQAQAAGRDRPDRQGQTDNKLIDEYRIKRGDVLTVFVFNHPELSRERLTVQPDGRVSTPLVQSIPALGLTPAQLKVEIEKKLNEVFPKPNVTVILESR